MLRKQKKVIRITYVEIKALNGTKGGLMDNEQGNNVFVFIGMEVKCIKVMGVMNFGIMKKRKY